MSENSTKYTFDYNMVTTGMVQVSVMKLGLVFNSETIKVLSYPKKINIGIDVKNNALSIKASNGDKSIKEYDFSKKGNEKWLRVNSRPVVRAIEEITKVKYTDKMQSYMARFDNELNMLIVDLKSVEKVVEDE